MRKIYFFCWMSLMVLCSFLTQVQAQTIWDGTADVSWYNASETNFYISTPEELAGVAQLVNNHTTTFSGKTINLTADIWLNDEQDSTNNWIPIGGDATATGEDTHSETSYSFQGHFNGHGYSIYNMYCEKIGYFQAGLFGCISNPCTIDSLVMVNPIVKARGMAGALVGYTLSGGHLYISECLLVNIRVDCSLGSSTGNNNGGIIGGNWKLQNTSYWTYITNCGVTGLVHGKYIGGIAGNGQKINATNVYFAGTLIPELESGANKYGGIVGHCDNDKISLTNCYSNMPSPTTYSSGRDGTIMTDVDMQNAVFVSTLGTSFMMDNGINNGYPIMSYMCGISPSTAEICTGESITLTAFGYDTYQWNTGANTASITVSPAATTTYTVTGSSASGASGTHSATITVFPQAVITATVMPGTDGQTHGTVNPATTTLVCGSSDNVTLSVYPDANYRVSRVLVSNIEVYGDDFGEISPTVFTINPNGTLADVKIYLSNTYTITTTILMDDGTTLNNNSLVQPFGTNGVYTIASDGTVQYSFNETARYHISDISIDDNSYGVITSYDFEYVHDNHTIVATYTDACGIQALPFSDSFEGTSTSQVPECYAKLSGSSYPYTSSSYAHTGNRSIYAYLYTTDYYYFILPRIIDTLTYPMNSLMLTFWGRSSSTANTFTVGVMTDPANQNTFTALQTFTPANTNTYEQFIAYFNSVDMTEIYGSYIAIKINPNTNYSSVYLDDISVDIAPTCSPVRNLELTSVYGTNASISWDANAVGGALEYNVYVYDVANEYAEIYQTTDANYMINGLSENSQYQVGVFVTCEAGDESDTVFINITTPCNSPVAVTIGSGTSSTQGNYFPTNTYYNYSLTQQIISASELNNTSHDFNGLAVQYFYNTAITRNMTIYLAHVPDTNLASGWITPSADILFEEVYTGNVAWNNSGTDYWFNITFDNIFSYNGTDNILVTFVDNTGSYTSNDAHFYTHSDASTTNMSRYVYRDGSPYNYQNPDASGTASSNVNNFQFIYCDASNCIRPNSLSATNVSENSADISWVSAGSESSWEVEYMAASDADWTSYGTVNANSMSLTNLIANTPYQVRVRSVCGVEDYSIWSIPVSFRTSCASISVTNAPWVEDFENSSDDPDCWISASTSFYNGHTFPYVQPVASIAHGGSKALEIAFGNIVTAMPQFDESLSDLLLTFWAYTNQYSSSYSNLLEIGYITEPNDVSTFVPLETIHYTNYTKVVMSFTDLADLNLPATTRIAFRFNQQSSSNQTSWYIDDISVEIMPSCMQPYDLSASNIGETEVTLAWTELGTATGWNIEYGSTGFTPGSGAGTSVYADENPFTVEGLTSGTAYDFYVQADCGSTWEGPITVVTGQYIMNANGSDTLTTCGMVIYDNGGPSGDYSTNCNSTLVLYPASADSKLSLTGTANIENNWDFLYIYDGVGTSGTAMTTVTGENQTVNVLSTTGPLTLLFTSDGSVVKSGFELIAQCVSCYPPAGLSASNVSLDEATISWSGNADEYDVYVILTDTTYYTTIDTFITLTNLLPSSTYRVIVRSVCGTDYSDFSQAFSFNTSCGQITIDETTPWFEDFEGYGTSGGAVPVSACWATPETYTVSNGTAPFVYLGYPGSAYSGENTLEMKGSPIMVVLPEFSNDINTLRISMWGNTTAANASDAGTMALGYISNIYDPTSFVAIDTIPATAFNRIGTDAPHANFIGPYDFSGVTPQAGLRIALRLTDIATLSWSSDPHSWNLDDITVSLIPGCPSPVKTSVTYSNVDGHNATISWVDHDATHDSWTVFYKANNETTWQSVTAGPTPSADLNNLDPETTYEVYVVTNCATPDQVTDETNHIHFTTAVACPAPQNLTVTNIGMTTATVSWSSNASSFNIEYGETGFTPGTGISATAYTTTYDLTGLTSGTAYTVYITADCGGIDGSSSAATTNFSTSLCDVTDQCSYTFSLEDSFGDGWNGASITVQQNGITVATLGVSSGYSATEAVVLCDNESTSLIWNSGNYDTECSFTVTDPTGATIYTSSGVSSGNLYTFTTSCSGATPPACNVPTNLIATATAYNAADVTWTAGGTETSWNLQYKAAAAANWGSSIVVNTTSYHITGLTAETAYQIRVQAVCSNSETSDWATASFNTPVEPADPCDVPTGLTVNNITHNSATATWTPSGNETSWNIQYKLQSASQWQEATVNTTSYDMAGLNANSTYDVRVKAICAANNQSDFVTTTFTTLVDAINDVTLAQNISLMPNPADNYIELSINSNVDVNEAIVYNAFGQMIQTVQLTENHARIDLSNMAAGMYFVRVNGEGVSATKKFIKR